MRVYAKSALRDFWRQGHADAQIPLRTWYSVARSAVWISPMDVKRRFPDASIVSNNRVVFNVKGNSYRVVVQIHYDKQRLFIRFVGTHDEYDRIDSQTI
jgi:mRNA interferase HigB